MAITHSLVATDWEVNNITGRISYTGHDHNGADPSYATVIEFHRWLQGLADDQAPASTDDKMYIPIPSPSSRATDNQITLINGFYITAVEAEHLYDGSIIQNDGDDIWDGVVNYGNANVQVQIIQDGAIIADDFWNYNYGAACDTTDATGEYLDDTGGFTGLSLAGYTILNDTDNSKGIALSNTNDRVTMRSSSEFTGGTNDYFTIADNYLLGVPLNPDSGQGISHRFLVKVRADGADIDGRRLVGICRRLGNTFAWFPINGTGRGNNVLSLADSQDNNFDTAPQTVIGTTWDTDFSGEDQGFQQFDVDDDLTNEDYFGKLTWINTHDINDLYQRAMGETADHAGTGTAYTVHGLDGELLRGVTNSIGYDTETGGIAIADYDKLVWGTYINTGVVTGGPFQVGEVITDDPYSAFKARVLSVDGTDTSLVVSIEEGVLGTAADIIGVTSGATATTSADPAEVTGGGVLHVLAEDETNDILYVQVFRGTMATTENDKLYDGGTDLSAADHTKYVQVALGVEVHTEYAISKTAPYIGVSTGTAIIGAHGVGIDDAKLNDTDKVLPLGETALISAPLTVTNDLSGLASGDQVLVAPTDGTTTDINGDPPVGAAWFTIETLLNGAAESAISVNEDLADSDIDTFLPSAGYISIVNDEGTVVTLQYDSYSGATDDFTLTSTYDFSGSGVNDSVSVGNYAYVYQMHLTTALTTGAETSAIVNSIVGSTPDTGTIRIVNDDGFHIRHPYSGYVDASETFTITSAAFDGDGLTEQAAIGAGVYVTYLDKSSGTTENFQATYDNDLNLVVVVRDGAEPIKEDKKRWTFTSADASLGITRISDA